jgi:putative alpha-1,2-mannosidase
VTVTLENGKQLIINASSNSNKNIYVDALQFNGKTHTKNWLNHFDLMKGGTLSFIMRPTPNKSRGTTKDAYPYSLSINDN